MIHLTLSSDYGYRVGESVKGYLPLKRPAWWRVVALLSWAAGSRVMAVECVVAHVVEVPFSIQPTDPAGGNL